MAARMSTHGDVEIEFYIVRTDDGISIWTDPPQEKSGERYGPFVATALVPLNLAPKNPPEK